MPFSHKKYIFLCIILQLQNNKKIMIVKKQRSFISITINVYTNKAQQAYYLG